MQQVATGINPVDGSTFVTVYIDDLLMFSSLMKHLDHLSMSLILEKLEWSLTLLSIVSYVWGRMLGTCHNDKPNAKLVNAVQDYVPPQNIKELKWFLGFAFYL